MHLKNYNEKKFKRRKNIYLIPIIIILLYFFYIITSNISYFYLNYSKKEARQIIDRAINTRLICFIII
jgi:hypothetical protein